MRISTRTLVPTAALLALALPLAACGSEDDDVSQPPVAPGPQETTDDATQEPTEDGTTDDATPEDTGGDDVNAGAFAAIDLAESEAGGTAFELDREGDGPGHWEVSVAVDGAEIEVDVDLTGTEVLGTDPDGDLSPDEIAGLDLAEVSMAQAIQIALDEVGGVVDEVDLEEGRNTVAWEVEMEGDIDVYVDVVTGEILEIDRD